MLVLRGPSGSTTRLFLLPNNSRETTKRWLFASSDQWFVVKEKVFDRASNFALSKPEGSHKDDDENYNNNENNGTDSPNNENTIHKSDTDDSDHSVLKEPEKHKEPTTVPANLWKVAEEQLDEKSRKWLLLNREEHTTDSVEEALAKVISEVEDKYKDHQKGGLRIRERGDGAGRFDVRGSAKKVLVSVLQVQDLIKTVAGFDPTGHASTAWSVVSFGLTLVRNDIERRDAIMEASEFLAKVLAYHSIIDHNYRQGDIPSPARLGDALVDLYVAVLRYAAEVQRTKEENIVKRAEGILMRIEEMAKQVHSIDVRTNGFLTLAYTTKLSRIAHLTLEYGLWTQATYTKSGSPHLDIFFGCMVLWAAVNRSLEHGKHDSMSHTSNMPQAPSKVDSDSLGRSSKEPRPGWDGLLDILDEVIDSSSADVFFVFDALDECPAEIRERRLLAFLDGLTRRHATKLHLLATSRPEPDIHGILMQHKSFGLEDTLGDDVERFVQEKLKTGKLSRWEDSILEKIRKQLQDVPERRFRWADLQIKRLEKCHIPQDIDEALATIPDTLDATYQSILEKEIRPKYHDAVQLILTWLTFSVKPLTQEDVAHVAGFPSPDSVIEICTTQLVTLNTSDGTITLAHFSVKEFLLSERTSKVAKWYHMSEILGHRAILKQIFSHLLAADDLSTRAAMDNPLLSYSFENWSNHLKRLESISPYPSPELYPMILELFTMRADFLDRMSCVRKVPVLGTSDNVCEVESPIKLAILFDLVHLVDLLLPCRLDTIAERTVVRFSMEEALVLATMLSRSCLILLLQRVIMISDEDARKIINGLYSENVEKRKLELLIGLLWNMGALYGVNEGNCVHPAVRQAMARNKYCGDALLEICLNRMDKEIFPITEKFMKAVVYNKRCGDKVLEILLRLRKNEIHFTEPVMDIVVKRIHRNPRLATLVLENRDKITCLSSHYAEVLQREPVLSTWNWLLRRTAGFAVSEMVLIEAASNNNEDVMQLLMNNGGLQIPMREELMVTAASNRFAGLSVLRYLLLLGPKLRVSPRVLETAAGNPCISSEDFGLVLDNFEEAKVPDSVFVVAYAIADNMKLLLDRSDNNAPMRGIIDKRGSEIELRACDTLRLFLDRQILVVDEWVVGTLAGNRLVFELLTDNVPQFPINERVIEVVKDATKRIQGVLMVLLEQKRDLDYQGVFEELWNEWNSASSSIKRETLCTLLGYCDVEIAEGMVASIMATPDPEKGGRLIELLYFASENDVPFCSEAMELICSIQSAEVDQWPWGSMYTIPEFQRGWEYGEEESQIG
ncbi:uncharacterized protein BO97DRAFT_450808 [Aspergillus homomorphus CBS 101889]|uniref:NACHT domain-containing protein n=1 Tax=Aspergillus homomorphus (strain CBS 101889) TaxID=1450537 RepID=A0A395HZ83_ASPHC|nr:hypothetical protein BO97DRAFT_450808 [Aspergillus homomorphus CBS 101889]RAL12829.1 hypothetical protein BO97DRAFT_450808 [Aspergillus homomorphus CBS 101889]